MIYPFILPYPHVLIITEGFTIKAAGSNNIGISKGLDSALEYIVRVLIQCQFSVISLFQLKNGDNHPLSTTALSQCHKLFLIHHHTPILTHQTTNQNHGPPLILTRCWKIGSANTGGTLANLPEVR